MKKEPLDPKLSMLLAEYQLEGLIPDGFEPLGEHDHARRKSIESRAYIAWLSRNGDLVAGRDVEMSRTIFLKRHDRSWSPPPPEKLEPLIAPEPPRGFDAVAAALPKGDAYEGGPFYGVGITEEELQDQRDSNRETAKRLDAIGEEDEAPPLV